MVKCQCRICSAVLLLTTDCALTFSVSTGGISNGVPHHPHVLLAVASGPYLYAKYHSGVRSGGVKSVAAARDGWSEESTTPPPSGENTRESVSATIWEMPGVW